MTLHGSGSAPRRRWNIARLDRSAQLFALMIAVASAQLACNADGFELPVSGTSGDGGPGGDGDGGGDFDANGTGGHDDAGLDATPPLDACPVETEICDLQDNDCDGNMDEGFNLDEDPANCGECGMRCQLPHEAGTCDLGECFYECLPGFYDLDPDAPGCEYQCIVTNGGVEICDEADNDCDGNMDEGFNLTTDEDNCGGCGVECNVLHATPQCLGGECGYTVCDPGYSDFNPDIPGCEYTCPENPPLAQEECDGEDDDCDGNVDEQPITGFGDLCSDFPEGDVGLCQRGNTACYFGVEVCEGDVGPKQEVCNNKDDDCDGTKDDGFNKLTDEQNCGTCGHVCNIPNAVPICQGGTCGIFACNSGFVDSDGDGDPVEGCDYQCTPSGPEVCDGKDNDCDKKTDLADSDIQTPANFCKTAGECGLPNTKPQCSAGPCNGAVQWRCVYTQASGNVETDSCGNLLLQENDCDGLDNDCDTRVDEAYVLKGTACSDGDTGECVNTGTYVCAADPGDVNNNTNLTCNAVNDDGGVGVAEQCNNLDDDCDGGFDEDAPDEVVRINDGVGGLPTFYIQAYEASRPDADDVSSGATTFRTCSKPDVMPWNLVSRVNAQAACAATGKHLCSEEEWQTACERLVQDTYPYGDVYEAQTCNGRDFDTDSGTAGNQDDLIPTGDRGQCFADWGAAGDVFDMSGNLKEWTSSEVAADTYRVRGGSFNNIKGGLTCQFDFISFDEDIEFPNLGFRCCSANP